MFHVEHSIREAAEQQLQAFLRGCDLLGFSLTPHQVQQIHTYLELLLDWNCRMNLFAPGDAGRLAERHVLESIAWIRAFPSPIPEGLLDVGTGAGFPGLPIAVLLDYTHVVLLDSKRKKIQFLEHAIHRLGLKSRVRTVLSRVEELDRQRFAETAFPLITARAVAPLKKLVEWTLPWLCDGGKLVTFKGDRLEDEVRELTRGKNALKIAVQVIDYTAWRNVLDRPQKVQRRMVVVTRKGE
jgi:16S rRNA (guanine527-N7)-methyltransferase